MKKIRFIVLLLFLMLSILYVLFAKDIYYYIINIYNHNNNIKVETEYLYGEGSSGSSRVKLKILTDPSGRIKEIEVVDYSPKDETVEFTLQKLITSSIDKYESSEISDVFDDNYDLVSAYKKSMDDALNIKEYEPVVSSARVSMTDTDVLESITRNEKDITRYSIKTGFGAYIINNFTNADRNKNGNLSTHEYLCAVSVEQNGRISAVKFDHISSNISYTLDGKIPTGNARSYKYQSDKSDPGFNGLCNDGNYINMLDFEKRVVELKYLAEVQRVYENRTGYSYFVKALQNAVVNSKYVGANKDDNLGLASFKELSKKDIIDASDKGNGRVVFYTYYMVVTTNKDMNISSCIVDITENDASITKNGTIFGSAQSQAYSIGELSNIEKYSKIEQQYVSIKKQLNDISDKMTNKNVADIINEFSANTDNRGFVTENGSLYNFVDLDFTKIIETLSDSYIDSRKIS